MSKRRTVLAGALLVGAAVVTWFVTMPYPVRMWRECRQTTRYSSAWAVSKSDFVAAKRLVRKELGFREIINRVAVTGPNEIHFGTLCEWRGPVAGQGQTFVVRKVKGKWEIIEHGMWVS